MKKVGTAFLTTLFIFSSFTSANAEEKKDNKAFIDVSAATLWTAPDALRFNRYTECNKSSGSMEMDEINDT